MVTDEVCKVCGAELQPAIPEAEFASQVTSDPTPRVYNDVIPPFTGPSEGIGRGGEYRDSSTDLGS